MLMVPLQKDTTFGKVSFAQGGNCNSRSHFCLISAALRRSLMAVSAVPIVDYFQYKSRPMNIPTLYFVLHFVPPFPPEGMKRLLHISQNKVAFLQYE